MPNPRGFLNGLFELTNVLAGFSNQERLSILKAYGGQNNLTIHPIGGQYRPIPKKKERKVAKTPSAKSKLNISPTTSWKRNPAYLNLEKLRSISLQALKAATTAEERDLHLKEMREHEKAMSDLKRKTGARSHVLLNVNVS